MARMKLPHAVQVRTDRRIHAAFRARIAELKARGSCDFAGGEPTMEAVTSALWLWLACLELGEADAFLGHALPVLEKLLRGSPGIDPALCEPMLVAGHPTRRRARKGRKPA